MNNSTINELKSIGIQLDSDIYPLIHTGGIVVPSDSTKPAAMGGVYCYERQGKRRPETRPRQRTARWQRPTNRSRSTNEASQIICTDLQAQYCDGIASIRVAYPNTKVWNLSDGMWLITESQLLPGLHKKAIIVTCIPFSRTIPVRGWGFWEGITWIGPRHNNFPDGSICAFDPVDRTWNIGDSLIQLLDLYTLWALRHLHLEIFDRWPGKHTACHPYERVLELKKNEFCGCGKSNKLYRDCCRTSDFDSDLVANAVNFTIYYSGGLREPPAEILRFVREKSNPPNIINGIAGTT